MEVAELCCRVNSTPSSYPGDLVFRCLVYVIKDSDSSSTEPVFHPVVSHFLGSFLQHRYSTHKNNKICEELMAYRPDGRFWPVDLCCAMVRCKSASLRLVSMRSDTILSQ
jgi:hypothetical protein